MPRKTRPSLDNHYVYMLPTNRGIMEPIDKMTYVMRLLLDDEVQFVCAAINRYALHESRVGFFQFTDTDGSITHGTAATHPVATPNNLHAFGRAFVVDTLDLAMPDLTPAGVALALVIRGKVV